METAEGSRGTSSEKTGQVWIWVQEAIPRLEETIVVIKLKVVDELIDATILQPSDAEQVTRKANQEYSEYLGQPVPARGVGEFVVQGKLRE